MTTTDASIQASPLQRANSRAMKAMDETEKLIAELRDRLQCVLRPLMAALGEKEEDSDKPTAWEVSAPLVEGTIARAIQIENSNFALRDIISRIEL